MSSLNRYLSAKDIVFLLMGVFMVIFNRFAAHAAFEFQTNVMGMNLGEPVKGKKYGSWVFIGMGLFFLVIAMISVWSAYSANRPKGGGNVAVNGSIFLAPGLLGFAIYLVVFQKTASRLATEQAREILGPNVPEQLFHYVLLVFVGVLFVCGATMIGAALSQ